MVRKLLGALLFSFTITICAQVTNEGIPASWNMTKQKSSINAISLPLVDIQKVKREDDINDKLRTKPYRIGLQIKANYGLDNAGSWTELSNGDRIWRILFESKDALNLGLIFDKFYLPEGAKIYLYNDDRSDLLGAYTDTQNNEKQVLTTWFVKGDKLWMEYYEPFEVKDQGKLNISSVMHGYRLGHTHQKGYFNEVEKALNSSGDCNHDVDCPIGADFDLQRDLLKKGVGLLLIPIGTNVGICSGTLVNNTAEDKKPFFLTANHCFGSSDPSTYSIRFNWISPDPVCAATTESTTTSNNFTMSGTTLRAINEDSDVMLVEINSTIPSEWDVTYAGWDRTDAVPSFVVGIHHPQGDIMKICRDNSGVIKAPHSISGGPTAQTWEITTAGGGWELGVTEGGSSGSALFDQDGRIIGQLFGGAAFCSGTDDNGQLDFYGRFAVSWDNGGTPATQLKDWLDPLNTPRLTTLDALENVLAVNDEFLEANISVYPNPTTGELQIKTSGLVGELEYQVFNVLGQMLKKDILNNESLNLSSLSENIYFIKVTEINTNKSLVKKIVLSK
jgi:hypothetical protein